MSDALQHECGIAMVRLLKPLEHYHFKYGSCLYGLNKLYLLMEKQRNRGQDGTGALCVKTGMPAGSQYIFRERSVKTFSIDKVFKTIYEGLDKLTRGDTSRMGDVEFLKREAAFVGELYLGHLRYGTFGNDTLEAVHPVIRPNNWKTRNLVLAGNFNLTNVSEIFNTLTELGQAPVAVSDTVIMLENLGHFLDRENQRLFDQFKKEGYSNVEISALIAQNLSIPNVLRDSSKRWDGGYAIAGIVGDGDAFVYRDPAGIRPAYYYHDEEVAVVASERAVIQTAFDVPCERISEVKPGYVLTIRKDGRIAEELVQEPRERRSCSFERIYFSRGSDQDIYNERKKLGALLLPDILESVDSNLENTVFSYIPNTAESAFFGMIQSANDFLNERKKKLILEAGPRLTPARLDKIMSVQARVEKVAIKDAKLRTFITQDRSRAHMVGHVYDITYGTLRRGQDNLVIIDDSIVRGTTLKLSIIKILNRLGPRKIIIVSSSPQIRYPDCYGIDMARLDDFIAFQAAIGLLRETGRSDIINQVYLKCKEQEQLPSHLAENHVKQIYAPFTDKDISRKIAQMLHTSEITAELDVIYQSIGNLHTACPNDLGDWYFTGDYPTPGGNRVANRAFINYVEGRHKRAY
jgi:amidophosphoribosyltransferase